MTGDLAEASTGPARSDRVCVLHIIASVDPRGGGPIEGVFASAEVWARHGHSRHIVSLDPPDAPWLATARAPAHGVGLSGPLIRLLRERIPWMRYGYTPHLATWLNKNAHKYDAIVINGLWNYASLGSWRALRRSRTPYYVFTHGMIDPWFNSAYPLKTLAKRAFWRLFEHRVLRDAAGVLFTCEEERLRARGAFHPYRAREFVVGYGARDLSGDSAVQIETFLKTAPGVIGRKFALFLGRLHEKKGINLLIEAFAKLASRHPDFDLVVAGPDQGGIRGRLHAQARGLGLETRIHWPGMLSGDAKSGALRAARFFVLPSHQENFGISVAESLAAGTPVLITDKVNIWREIVADGAGLVVADTSAGIETGLASMFALSEAERSRMADAARRSFLSRFDIEKNALDLLRLVRNRQDPPANAV